MSAHHSTKWFWSDWLGDQEVRRLTPAERGVWIDLLGLAAVANPVGYVCDDRGRPLTHEEIARVTNAASPVEVAELIDAICQKGAASRDRAGRLYNRRMVREAALAAKRRVSGSKGGKSTQLKWLNLNADATAKRLANTTAKPDARLLKKESYLSSFSSEQVAARGVSSELVEKPKEAVRWENEKPPHALSRAELEERFARASVSHETGAKP